MMVKKTMAEIIIIMIFTLCATYVAYLKSKLNIAEYELKIWNDFKKRHLNE